MDHAVMRIMPNWPTGVRLRPGGTDPGAPGLYPYLNVLRRQSPARRDYIYAPASFSLPLLFILRTAPAQAVTDPGQPESPLPLAIQAAGR